MSLFCSGPSQCLDPWQPEIAAAILSGVATFLATVVSVGIAALLAYRFALRQSDYQHNTQIRADRLRREIDALETLWELLAYMTDKESACAILSWRKDTNGRKTYYAHFERLKEFVLVKVSEIFYARHAGLHIPSTIAEQLFEYHSILTGIYFRYADSDATRQDPLIELENPHMIDKLLSAYREINAGLRDELILRYRLLSRGNR